MNTQHPLKISATASNCPLHTVSEHNGENKLLLIIAISLVTMIGEILGGTIFGSMALLADGWHMGTHVLALGIAYAAVILARRIATDHRFAFGPAKVSALGGFAGAILLAIVAFEMVGEGIHRLMEPETILFNEAIFVAAIGLAVNTVGAFLLHEGAHDHHHEHGGGHSHSPKQVHRQNHDAQNHSGHTPKTTPAHAGRGHDANMHSAYLHVITDALTSVLAIAALFLGKQFGWVWADAAVAMLGGVIILKWAYGLLRSSGATLLDFVPNRTIHDEIKRTILEKKGTEICDLHIWPQGSQFGLLATVTAHNTKEKSETIHQRLQTLGYLNHITIEVRPCNCCS